MPVNSKHTEYTENMDKWAIVHDCNDGAKSVKSQETKYLPQPNPLDKGKENKARYLAYIARANFVNFVASTCEGLIGLIFRKKTEIELTPDLEYLIKNANGDGLTLDQMIKESSSSVLKIGRDGLLVDYPNAEAGLTEAEVQSLNLRANILPYKAESILNWQTKTVGGANVLSLVVLYEPRQESVDGFEYESVDYYRVLSLKDSVYIQNIYNGDGELLADAEGNADIIPKNKTGGTWNKIPFTFIGSTNNDSKVDKAPLYDIAEVNISHYRNSADYEESSFLVGQPTPVIAGLTASWVTDVLKGEIGLGSRGAIMLPEGGSATLLQASENQMPSKGMDMKEAQILKIGARLIQDTGGNETVDAAKMRFSGQNSKLGSIIQNVEAAYIQCLEWVAEFMGGSNDFVLNINKEFYDASIDPQMIIAQIQLIDRGIIANNDIRDYLRNGNIIDSERTNDDIDGEAETIM